MDRRRFGSLLAGCVAGIGGFLFSRGAEAVATEPKASPAGYELRLSAEGRERLRRATKEGRVVAPERIADSVRRFAEAPDATVILESFEDPNELGFHGTCFHARIEAGENSHATGLYSCRAADGRVFGLIRRGDPDPDLPPVVTEARAEEIARQFLLRKCPEFPARCWAQDYRWSHDNADEFDFNWTQVLNSHGTRAIYDLRVAVQKSTGQVVSFSCPPDRVAGPVVPGITLAQAKVLGGEYAAYDLAKVPFSPCYPQLSEDPHTGKQSLWWRLHQVVQLGEGSWADCVVQVEALTGAEIVPPAHQPGVAGASQPHPYLEAQVVAETYLIDRQGNVAGRFVNRDGRDMRLGYGGWDFSLNDRWAYGVYRSPGDPRERMTGCYYDLATLPGYAVKGQ